MGFEGSNLRYRVTAQASDGGVNAKEFFVAVDLKNLDEMGTVTLSSLQPQADRMLTATLSDPDTMRASPVPSWKWARSDAPGGEFTDISGAETVTYTPLDGDVGKYLRATVTYADGEDEVNETDRNKKAMVVSANPAWGARNRPATPCIPRDRVSTERSRGTQLRGPRWACRLSPPTPPTMTC